MVVCPQRGKGDNGQDQKHATPHERTEPEVEKLQLIKVDLSNRDEAIAQLKAEADAAHKDFVECLERAKGMSKELDELFAHRDFLKGEGDRFHKEFWLAEKRQTTFTQKSLS